MIYSVHKSFTMVQTYLNSFTGCVFFQTHMQRVKWSNSIITEYYNSKCNKIRDYR